STTVIIPGRGRGRSFTVRERTVGGKIGWKQKGSGVFNLICEESKAIRILEDRRAQRESIHRFRFANQNTPIDLRRLAKELLPNAAPLTPEERVSINEFFWSHFK